jgi:hypothetical protein
MARHDEPKTTAPVILADPPYAWAWAALAFLLCALALGYPALAGQFLVSPISDQFKAGYSFREFAAASLRAGQGFPQWNPYLLGGMPYIAAMHGDIFYPTFVLRMIMRTDQAMTWEFIIHLWISGAATYALLRACRFGFFPSLIGGIAYMLSGPIAGYASPGHDGKLFVSALTPLALLLLVRGVRDGKLWSWGALAVVVGLAVLSPHPPMVQYMLLTCGAFALYLAFSKSDGIGALPRDVAIKRLGFALGAVLLGMVIGAIQYMPVFEYVPWSPRAGGRGYEFASSYSMPLEELLNTIVPQFTGMLNHYWGRNGIHFHSEYAGAAVIFLATAAAGGEKRRSFRWFWVGTLIVTLLWALGGSTPFFRIIYALVPGTKFFRAPSAMMYVTMLCVCVLAAMGTERLLERKVGSRFIMSWGVAAALLALLGTSGGFTNVARVIAHGFAPDGQLDEAITRNAPDLVFGTLRSALVIALGLVLAWGISRQRVSAVGAGWVLAALVALDLWSIERKYWMFSPPASTLFASDAAIDMVRNAPQPGRVLAIDILGSSRADPIFNHDGLMAHRVRTVNGYHGNELGRFELLLGKVNADGEYAPELLFAPTVWRHENVQYFYTTLPDSLVGTLQQQLKVQSGPWTRIAGPLRNAAGTQVYLYRLPGDNPYAWTAPLMVKAPDDQAQATVINAQFDPRRVAIVDTGASAVSAVPASQVQALPAPAEGGVTVKKYDAGAVDLELERPAVAGQALIVSENYYPGWHAIADGKAAPVARMNYNLIGVALPAGARSVQLRFDDAAYETGKVITIIALLLALAAWIAGALVARRPARESLPA